MFRELKYQLSGITFLIAWFFFAGFPFDNFRAQAAPAQPFKRATPTLKFPKLDFPLSTSHLEGVVQPLEAEDATLNGPQIANDHPHFTGTGFADYIGEGSIAWDVTIETAGLYQLEFRYALASGDRPLNILGSNGILIKSNVSFPATGGFDVWKTVTVFTKLDAGPNTIKAVTTGVSGANMDHLVVSLTPPDLNRFLSFPIHSSHKVFRGSEDNAKAYYKVIDPNDQRTTFEDWKQVNGLTNPQNDPNVHHATYFNGADLAFARDMYVKVHKSADGKVNSAASYVQNYLTLSDAVNRTNLLATVAMEYGPPEGNLTAPRFTKFFVFDKDGNRLTKIDLDGRGAKYVPGLCNVCHGGKPKLGAFHGSAATYQDRGDTGGKWIPWDLDTYQFHPSKTRAQQEAEFKKLNSDILEIYRDRPRGTSVTNSTAVLIKGWYGGEGLPNTKFNGNYVPPGWKNTSDGNKSDLYLKVVGPTCRACHNQRGSYHNDGGFFQGNLLQSSLEFNSYHDFKGYKDQIAPLVYDMGVMPAARQTFENFWRSDAPKILDDELFGGQVYQNPNEQNPTPGVAHSFGALRRPGRPIANIAGIPTTFGVTDKAPIGNFCFQGPIFSLADVAEGSRVRLNGRSSLFAESFTWSFVDPPSSCFPVTTPTIASPNRSLTTFELDSNHNSDIKSVSSKPYYIRLRVTNEFADFNPAIIGQLFTDSSLKPLVFADSNPATKDIYKLLTTNFPLSGASGSSGPLQCMHCHSNGILGRAGGIFEMWDVTLPGDANSELWKRIAYNNVMTRVDCNDPGNSLILKKPAGHHHNGGTVQGFGVGSGFNHLSSGDDSNREALLRWIMEGAPYAGTGESSDLGCPTGQFFFPISSVFSTSVKPIHIENPSSSIGVTKFSALNLKK